MYNLSSELLDRIPRSELYPGFSWLEQWSQMSNTTYWPYTFALAKDPSTCCKH